MKYQEERFADLVEEIKPLNQTHWEEVANNKDVRPLDPDYDTYIKLNELNIVRIFTARDEDRLVGYFIFVIAPNLHYKTWDHADVDVYWIDPAYRKQTVGFELVRFLEARLSSYGVKVVTMMDKIKHPHEKFFSLLGYTKIENIYEKII